jgi:hypothetical protein
MDKQTLLIEFGIVRIAAVLKVSPLSGERVRLISRSVALAVSRWFVVGSSLGLCEG